MKRINQGSYHGFSSVYDKFMGDAPYAEWRRWFQGQTFPRAPRIADVGCGTGVLTSALAERAAIVYGIDSSEEMLSVAASRVERFPSRIRFMCQDMRELRLPEQVDLIVSTCDCVNYLLTREDVYQAFARFRETLPVGGRLCFDVLGPQRVQKLRGGFSYDIRETEEIWFLTDVSQSGRISYLVHGFTEKDEERQLFERFVEEHQQQYYSVLELTSLLEEAGFQVGTTLGDFGETKLEESDRVALYCVRIR